MIHQQEVGLASACAFLYQPEWYEVPLLTMSRLTLDDGRTEDPRLTSLRDKKGWGHALALAPATKMVGRWYRKEICWADFTAAYLDRLNGPSAGAVDDLILLAQDYHVVVTCVEKTPEECHRRLLLEECGRRCPALKITIR